MKSCLTIAAGICVSALLFVPIMEVADTNEYDVLSTDPASGLYRYTPDSSFTTASDCYENEVTVNNLGFHGPPVSPEKGKDVFRIVVVGSSYVSAIQVPVAGMYSTLLQNELNANVRRAYTYEVIPIAIGGQSRMLLDILYYLNYGSSRQPDLVIDIESDQELIDERTIDTSVLDSAGGIVHQAPKSGESPAVAWVRAVSRHSKFLVNLYNRFLVLKSNTSSFLAGPFASTAPASPAPDAATMRGSADAERELWQSKQKMLAFFAAQARRDGAQFVYATWSGPWAATSTASQFPLHGRNIAEQGHFSSVDLVPFYRRAETASGASGTYACDPHWNAAGNRFIADALYAYLAARPGLLSRIAP